MVVTKVMQIKRTDRLKRAVSYILNDAKTLEVNQESSIDFPLVLENGLIYQKLATGHLIVDVESAAEEFILTKKNADHFLGRIENSDLVTGKGVLAHHIIQSFSPDDQLSPQEIHELGRKTALELTGGQYEFVIATHVDRDHIHNHIIFNSTNSTTLKKFRWQKGTKRNLDKISDRYADLAGAKIIDKENKTLFDHKAYSAYRKNNSFKIEIKNRLDFLLKNSLDLEDFKKKAQILNLSFDFSGKYTKYRLLNQEQERNTRDSSLSKRGNYSLEKIMQRLAKNVVAYSVEEIKAAYDEQVQKQDNDFEIRLTIEKWQVSDETKTGLYLDIEFGVRNHGLVKIPYRYVEKKEDGNFEIFIKKSDFFHFLNPDHSENNRFMKGETLIQQLSFDNGQYILRKHVVISKLDELVKEFEFLNDHDVTSSQQFQELSQQFKK